jgi:ribosomal protein S18 acetylase RimI-like enzyme
MQIRTITLSDHPNLVAFWTENYIVTETDSHAHFSLFLEKNPELSVLMEEEGRILGTVLGSYDGRRGYLQKVVTHKERRNQGIGRQLVTDVINRLRKTGAFFIPITVDTDVMPFYESLGFVRQEKTAMTLELSPHQTNT